MGAAKREAVAFEDMKHDLTQIAIATGAIRLDDEDGETLITRCSADGERRAYARATILCKRGRWPFGRPSARNERVDGDSRSIDHHKRRDHLPRARATGRAELEGHGYGIRP
jgi:hypothetical protein